MPVFGEEQGKKGAVPVMNEIVGRVNDNTKRLCKALELPLVCAHGLRGSHSTIAQEAGTTSHVVAKQLGHADERTTREHYTEPGLGKRKNRQRVLKVLEGGRND